MGSPWSELLANFAVVAMFVSVWVHTHVWVDNRSASARALLFGALMGAGAVVIMMIPMEFRPGVFADLRATMIALSGFFGGPLAGAVTALVAGAYRVWLGGAGMFAGCVSIAIAFGIGVAGHLALRGRAPDRKDVLLIAAALAPGAVLGFVVLPRPILDAVLPVTILPSTLLTFASTVLAGFVLVQERLRVEALHSRRIYKAIVEALPDCLNAKDVDGRFIAANPATAKLMRAPTPDALLGKSDFDFYPRETAEEFRTDETGVLETGVARTIEQRLVHENGDTAWLATLKAPLRDRFGNIFGLITHNRDITARKGLELALAQSRARLDAALSNMADGLVMVDASGKLLLCNEQYAALFPKTADLRVPGADHRDILRVAVARGEYAVRPEEVEAWIEDIVAFEKTDSRREITLADGRWLDVKTRQTETGESLTIFSDITAAKRAEAELRLANDELNRLAHRDGLTDLMTRRAFDDALAREFGRAQRTQTELSLLLIDVDFFKRFNDRYGHQAGDECLRSVSACIAAVVRRPGDSAARYGGEEFAAILPETDSKGAFVIAEKLRRMIRELEIAHADSDKDVVTASIGVATFTGGRSQIAIADLIRRADEALYGAKSAGRDRVHGWRPHVAEVAQKQAR
jgi:diguanylate cyclase (GGDEF)-like protein/PAS domain S-box-containing protein